MRVFFWGTRRRHCRSSSLRERRKNTSSDFPLRYSSANHRAFQTSIQGGVTFELRAYTTRPACTWQSHARVIRASFASVRRDVMAKTYKVAVDRACLFVCPIVRVSRRPSNQTPWLKWVNKFLQPGSNRSYHDIYNICIDMYGYVGSVVSEI